MPTIMEITGASYPGEAKKVAVNQPDGVSLVPTFSGKSLNRNKPVFYEYNNGAAIQQGSLKLVRNKNWELYDLSKDRTETKNIIHEFPEVYRDLESKWQKWYLQLTGLDYKEFKNSKKKK
jgi:arylsulfatase